VSEVAKIVEQRGYGRVVLLFEDEASFGRSNRVRSCWCPRGVRPRVPCAHIREYRHAFGAIEPLTGNKIFAVSHKCDTIRMYYFLKKISQTFPDDVIVLVCDGASWHKNQEIIPNNMTIVNLPTGAPEMNPMEQIWREIRTQGFANLMLPSLAAVLERFTLTVRSLPRDTVKSIAGRDWILSMG
jgi:putative transposase